MTFVHVFNLVELVFLETLLYLIQVSTLFLFLGPNMGQEI